MKVFAKSKNSNWIGNIDSRDITDDILHLTAINFKKDSSKTSPCFKEN